MSTRDALYTFTAECNADDATLGPGNTRILYDTGAAMCVCGPGQLPLAVVKQPHATHLNGRRWQQTHLRILWYPDDPLRPAL